MDESKFKTLAAQLRKPEGKNGLEIGEIMNKGNREINLSSIDALNLKGEEHVLEIGMGNGYFVSTILEKAESINYIGCDFSEDMIQEANLKNETHIKNGNVDFRLATAEELPVHSNSIDKIMTVNTIYFWENQTQVLAEFKRVLKPNGKLIIGIRPKNEMETYPMTKYGFNMFTEEEVVNLLKANGLKTTQVLNKKESDKDFFGKPMKVSSLIIVAEQKLPTKTK